MATIEDFNQLDIRIGKVLSVEKIQGTDKLLKFRFDMGDGERDIVARMAEFFSDLDALKGKELPVLVNIEPRTLKGQINQGMILAAAVDECPVLLHPEREVAPGSRVR